jgi:hypothetical protein
MVVAPHINPRKRILQTSRPGSVSERELRRKSNSATDLTAWRGPCCQPKLVAVMVIIAHFNDVYYKKPLSYHQDAAS